MAYARPMRALFLLLALGGCGKVTDLRPAAGQPLPVAPRGVAVRPTAAQLLTPPTTARPDRIDEPLLRSEPRRDDPFDLPPPSGVQDADAEQTQPIDGEPQ